MRRLVFVAGFVVLVVVCEKYTTKYDNVDINEILKSDRLLKNYIDCVMDRGKCTPDGKELRDNMSDALQTACAKCSKKQKDASIQVLKYMVKNRRPMFDEVAAKFDPDGAYVKKHKVELEKEGIII